MEETDGAVGAPDGPGRDAAAGQAHNEYRVDIDGNVSGPVVAGNHNVVIDAQHGSTVTLLAPQERPRPVRRDRVALLPRRRREPVGRDADLAALEEAVRAGGPVQLWGPPGVGKSTLLRYAARCLEPGPDGALFLNAAHREAGDLAQEIFEACYEAPGYAPTGPELRRLMAGVRVTVYLDDADLPPEQLDLLADAAPDATFVLAGRERTLLGEGTPLELQGLRREAGLELLARELGRPLPEGERAAAGELCMLSLGRPLLLLRAAGLARLDAPDAVRLPRPAQVKGLLPLLLDRLDAAATSALHLLATLGDAELAPAHIGALCRVADPAALCGDLAGLGLALATERGYRCAPDAVPEVRRRNPRAFPADRLCDHFAGWAALPSTTPAQVADHGRALELAAELAEHQGRPDLAVRVARAVSPALAHSLRFGVWGRLLDQGQDAARRAGDRTAEAYFTHEKAVRCLLVGQRVVAATLLAEAVVLWRELGDTDGVDAALNAQQYTPPPQPQVPSQPAPDGGALPGADTGTAPSPADGGTVPGADTTTTTTLPSDAGPVPGPDAGTVPGPDAGTAPSVPDGTAGSVPHGGDATTAGADFTPQGPGPDVAADPTSLAAPAPPGPDAAAQVMNPGVQSTAHSWGAATTGTTAGTGGGVAAGTVVASGVMTLVAAVAAIGIGVGVYQNQESDNSPPTVVSQPSETAWTDPWGSGTDTGDSGTDTWESEPDTSTGPGNDLAGVWEDAQGNGHEIVDSGDGSYTYMLRGSCGETVTVEVTGSDGSYSASEPMQEEGSCGVTDRKVDVTFAVAQDGSTVEVQKTAQSDGSWTCLDCEAETWTRVS
ncbi:ATP-binding protein [Streptomyces sp. SCUT-3]|uniref:ATP-binding protein n=1 Tax=Streptomyces sp. SCUT-3 TaxID=2684469 RepID=UPI0015F98541|nr:ATP-binding protein [Streptomyces sp. SCUT-3]QMV21794.1 ATP-binding protein [Streptomyces sp. SCUT-3]